MNSRCINKFSRPGIMPSGGEYLGSNRPNKAGSLTCNHWQFKAIFIREMSLPAPDALYGNPELLQDVLSKLTSGDNNTIKAVEGLLVKFCKRGECVAALIQQIQHCPNNVVKLQAALLLKRKVANLYNKFDQAGKLGLSSTLLNLFAGNNADTRVRDALAGCVAAIAPKVFKDHNGEWAELMQGVSVLTSSGDSSQMVLAFLLLEQLGDTCSKYLKKHMEGLSALFLQGCNNVDPKVAEKALLASSTYIRVFVDDPCVMKLRPVLVPALEALKGVLARDDTDFAHRILECFVEAAESKQALVNDVIPSLIPILVQIIQKAAADGEDMNTELTSIAGQTLISFIEQRPKLIANNGFVAPILDSLVFVLSRSETTALFNGPTAEEGEDEDFTPMQELNVLVQATLDQMSLHIPAKHFGGPALQHVSNSLGSPDAEIRRGGCAMLGTITEGLCDTMKPMLKDILPPVLNAVVDPNMNVRECACFALGQFAEHCQPEVLFFADQIMPALLQCLEGARGKVGVVLCYVIENYCENLQAATFKPYLDTQMNLLGQLLATAADDRPLQRQVLSAISASAVAAEAFFLPFAGQVVGVLDPLFSITSKEQFQLRGKALECLGHVAVAIGGDNFEPYLRRGLQCAMECLQLEGEMLNEYAYLYFANAAKVMGVKMVEFLPDLVPVLHQAASVSELTNEPPEGAGDDDDEYEEDDEEGGNMWVNIENDFVNSKKAAITALGNLAEATEGQFAPFLNEVIPSLLGGADCAINSFNSEIKTETMTVLPHFMTVALRAKGLAEKPAAGQVLPLTDDLKSLAGGMVIAYLEAMEEDSKEVVSSACEGMRGLFDQCGMALLGIPVDEAGQTPMGGELVTTLIKLLDNKAACQEVAEGEDDEDEEDDHDKGVMDSVCDCVGAVARAMGPQFDSLAAEFLPRIARFASPKRVFTDRIMALGCFGECFMYLGDAAFKYVDSVGPLVHAAVTDAGSESLRRNGAFCLGYLCVASGPQLPAAKLLEMMTWMSPLISMASAEDQKIRESGSDADNAVSAVARIIKARPDDVPIDQLLPLMLRALPIKNDLEEGENIMECLCMLVDRGHATALASYGRIVEIVATTALTANMSSDTKAKLNEWKLGKLQASDAAYVAAATPLQATRPDLFAYLSQP